jgi:hypothetical protein
MSIDRAVELRRAEDVERGSEPGPGNEVPAHCLKHEEGCACLDCLTELKAERIEDGDE